MHNYMLKKIKNQKIQIKYDFYRRLKSNMASSDFIQKIKCHFKIILNFIITDIL